MLVVGTERGPAHTSVQRVPHLLKDHHEYLQGNKLHDRCEKRRILQQALSHQLAAWIAKPNWPGRKDRWRIYFGKIYALRLSNAERNWVLDVDWLYKQTRIWADTFWGKAQAINSRIA